jgi:hypothetical protein
MALNPDEYDIPDMDPYFGLSTEQGVTTRGKRGGTRRPKSKSKGDFIHMGLETFKRAVKLCPSKVLAVYMIACRLARMGHTDTVSLTSAHLSRFGIDRKGKASALRALEGGGLIAVTRTRGKNPIVVLLDRSETSEWMN